jgi:CheY-like chemotaxis protein
MTHEAKAARVLFVGNDSALADATAMLLTAEGYEVIRAETADAAAAITQADERPPSVIVCDVPLGGIRAAIGRLRRLHGPGGPAIPTVLLTADSLRCLPDNADQVHVLRKPGHAGALIRLIPTLAERHSEGAANPSSRPSVSPSRS